METFYTVATWYIFTTLVSALVILGITIFLILRKRAYTKGLIILRRLLLTNNSSVFTMIFVAIVLLSLRYYAPREWLRLIITLLLCAFSTIALVDSVAKLAILRMKYTREDLPFMTDDRGGDK